jgi:hypothetical protein
VDRQPRRDRSLAAKKGAQQRFAYRQTITLAKPVKSAALFCHRPGHGLRLGERRAGATADPFPPWGQMPWKKFVRADVTAKLSPGRQHHRD